MSRPIRTFVVSWVRPFIHKIWPVRLLSWLSGSLSIRRSAIGSTWRIPRHHLQDLYEWEDEEYKDLVSVYRKPSGMKRNCACIHTFHTKIIQQVKWMHNTHTQGQSKSVNQQIHEQRNSTKLQKLSRTIRQHATATLLIKNTQHFTSLWQVYTEPE